MRREGWQEEERQNPLISLFVGSTCLSLRVHVFFSYMNRLRTITP